MNGVASSTHSSTVGKFGLTSHVSSLPTTDQRHDPDWRVVDQCILSWLYNSIAKDMRDILHTLKATTYRVWSAIHDQFHDNELHRVIYLEAEFRNLVQAIWTSPSTPAASSSLPMLSATSASQCARRVKS
jgi:hypothetical protein